MSESAPLNWKVGDVIADLYEVTGVLGEGAFGIVHKVHHRGWDMDLAVKSPRAEILGSEMAVRRFLREAETWVQLGLHPHIASCYYVRNLGGIPRMFIEYADAGTLRDWLRDGKVKDWCAMRAKGKRRAGTWRVAEHEAESLDSLCNCYRLDPIERSLS